MSRNDVLGRSRGETLTENQGVRGSNPRLGTTLKLNKTNDLHPHSPNGEMAKKHPKCIPGVINVPAQWLVDGFWTGDYDRWRARFDLLLVLPRQDGRVKVCVKELSRRWRWSERRARRLVEGLVEDGYLIHERRLSHGVLYRLADILVDDQSVVVEEGITDDLSVAPQNLQAGAEDTLVDSPQGATDDPSVAPPQTPAAAAPEEMEQPTSGETPSEPNQAAPSTSPQPKARSSPLAPVLQLTPSERSVAAEVLKCKPQLVDQMLEVWVEFKEVRRRCLSALEHDIPGCRLTERRAVKILDVLSSAGKDTVSEAVANLPYSHWHCATGRHAGSDVKLCPEAVFNAQQVQILSETPDKVPVWEQMGGRPPVQNWIDFNGQGKLVTFRRKDDVVPARTARALGL